MSGGWYWPLWHIHVYSFTLYVYACLNTCHAFVLPGSFIFNWLFGISHLNPLLLIAYMVKPHSAYDYQEPIGGYRRPTESWNEQVCTIDRNQGYFCQTWPGLWKSTQKRKVLINSWGAKFLLFPWSPCLPQNFHPWNLLTVTSHEQNTQNYCKIVLYKCEHRNLISVIIIWSAVQFSYFNHTSVY